MEVAPILNAEGMGVNWPHLSLILALCHVAWEVYVAPHSGDEYLCGRVLGTFSKDH